MKPIRGYKFISLLFVCIMFVSAMQGQTTDAKEGSVKNDNIQPTYTPSFENDGSRKPVKNVILMIGDGMGLTHISSGLFANHGALTMTNLKTIGLVRTQSANRHTTDSAASGTAYATGKKTNNGYVGVDRDGKALSNLTERTSQLGYATGILTTDNIDGATPSVFYAHQPDRGGSEAILGDLPKSKLTFFAAGHSKILNEALRAELKKSGFTMIEDCAAPNAAAADRLGILPEAKYTASVSVNRGDFLPRTTEFALEYLAAKGGDKGFFIMVEGARIDKSSHDNDFASVVGEVLDFDLAVEKAIRFAEKDGNTLVIITADHETGRLGLSSNGNIKKGEVKGYFGSKGHTPVMVPLFAYGPYSDMFTGVQENSDVSNKIYEIMSSQSKK